MKALIVSKPSSPMRLQFMAIERLHLPTISLNYLKKSNAVHYQHYLQQSTAKRSKVSSFLWSPVPANKHRKPCRGLHSVRGQVIIAPKVRVTAMCQSVHPWSDSFVNLHYRPIQEEE